MGLIGLAGLIALLYFGQTFFVTLIIAVIIAFLLEPFVGLLVRLRLPRYLASFVVCTVGLLCVYLGGLGVYTQSSGLMKDLPVYSERIGELIDSATMKLEDMERKTYELLVPERLRTSEGPAEAESPDAETTRERTRRSAEPPTPISPPQVQEVRIRPERTPLVAYVYAHLRTVYEIVLMASFVPFLVYFMLSWRDHFYRGFLHLFDEQDRMAAGRSLHGISSMVRAFVVGNFVLGLLLCAVTTLFCLVFKLPYAMLVGPLSGAVSLVPYIGLPLAMIPLFFSALSVYHGLTAYLIIGSTVAVLHLLALNLLYPKLVGSRVHLNPLVVTVALMLWGSLWGAIGLILAIPLTAAIKAVCDNVSSLQSYGKLLGD